MIEERILLELTDLRTKLLENRIQMNFIVTSGRTGSSLLASMIDMHEEVIIFPTPWYVYVDAKLYDGNLFEWSLTQGSLTRHWYQDGLGSDGKGSFDIPREDLLSVQKAILQHWESTTRRDQILAGLFSWAIFNKQNLSKIKTLIIHHHPVICDYAFNSLNPHGDFKLKEEGELWMSAKEDFPNLQLIWTIRHPLEMFSSIFKTLERERVPIDLSRWFMQIWGLIHATNSLLKQVKELGEAQLRLDFLEIHNSWNESKNKLIKFLKISDSQVLNKSTVNGLRWIGNNPEKPREGPQPGITDNEWESLNDDVKSYSCTILSELCDALGYPYQKINKSKINLSFIEESRLWSLNLRQDHPARLLNIKPRDQDKFLKEFYEIETRLYDQWCPGIKGKLVRTEKEIKSTSIIALPPQWKLDQNNATIPYCSILYICKNKIPKNIMEKANRDSSVYSLVNNELQLGDEGVKSIYLNPYHYDRDRANLILNTKKIVLVDFENVEAKEWVELAKLVKVDFKVYHETKKY